MNNTPTNISITENGIEIKATHAHLLVIDDKEENLNSLRTLLERENYRVTTAFDSNGGLDIIRREPPDLIICDLLMPGVNGLQFTQRVKNEPSSSHIPVILLSSKLETQDRIHAFNAGADDFIVKPVQRAELMARVRSLVRLKLSTDALKEAAEEKEQLYYQAQTRAAELTTLNEAALAVASKLSLPELLNSICQKSVELVKGGAAIIYLCDTENKTLTVRAEFNTPRSYLNRTLSYGEGLSGLIAITAKPMRINNYAEWNGKAQIYANDKDITGVLGVPLVTLGKVVGVLVVMDDVRKRVFSDADVRLLNLLAPQVASAVNNAKLYEDAHRERDRIRAVLLSVNDGILMLDHEFKVLLANQQLGELLEVNADQMLGLSIMEIAAQVSEVIVSEPPLTPDTFQRLLTRLSPNFDRPYQFKLTLFEPTKRSLEWSIIAVPDNSGAVVGWLNLFHDITKQRELEQFRDDFISMLVHDLRSPLTSIIGGIDLVSMLMPPTVPEGDENMRMQNEFLEQVQRNCYGLLDMVNALLEVSKLEAGKMPLKPEKATLENLIMSSIDRVKIMGQEKDIDVLVDIPKNTVNLNLDVDKMRRVLVNLLSNAIKFNPEHTEIVIRGSIGMASPGAALPPCWE